MNKDIVTNKILMVVQLVKPVDALNLLKQNSFAKF